MSRMYPAAVPHVREAILRPSDWLARAGENHDKTTGIVRGPRLLGRLKETAGAAPQPSPASPARPPVADATQAQALARRRPSQEARASGLLNSLSGRWLTNGTGMAGRGANVEGTGYATTTAGPALVGRCCTQETTSGDVPAQQYANCM